MSELGRLPFDNEVAAFNALLTQRLDVFISKTFQHLNDGQNLKSNWLHGAMACP